MDDASVGDTPERAVRREEQAVRWARQVETYRAAVATFQQAVQQAARRQQLRSERAQLAVEAVGRPAASAPERVASPAELSEPDLLKGPPLDQAGADPSPLTRRQLEVAALIARGYSNRRIADELVLTKGTVANHVEHILARLGFSCRAQVAVWAVGRQLIAPDAAGPPSPARVAGRPASRVGNAARGRGGAADRSA